MPSISIELFCYIGLGFSALWFLYIVFAASLFRLLPNVSGRVENISVQMLKKRDDQANFNPAASGNDYYKNIFIKYLFDCNNENIEGIFKATIKSDRNLDFKIGDEIRLHYFPWFPGLNFAATGISFINRREMVLAFFVNLFIFTVSTLFLWLLGL